MDNVGGMVFPRRSIAFTVLVGLTACTAAPIEPEHFRGPSGKDAYTMNCSGGGRTVNKCYTKAAEICPNGYNLIGQHTDITTYPVNYGTVVVPGLTLVFECK